ncbi:TetR/AcrR family transcriptional regulator [Pseudoclavibacter sp. VKM Ac-2867]|uniref:TetR/AcrR family transcriptional regulator n=1 Tax=Pseudoclavibacter sp. VKM Ac-2867 TaxID=2783829 RepID=UPI00188A4CF9|nr:TetR family transcriptional regulator [Pseudoclavibacter sp. VKM Ac-2867]MBF4459524.1 TetR/AcrR family transcriptional regulator [Pseudoclavibacter sp. VKM Ac-2867]
MQYDKDATRARIFAAADDEFARDGINGARVDKIAARAETSKALIYNYFGNKEQLFAEVVTARLTDFAESVDINPLDVPAYFTSVFDYLVDHPDIIRFMQHEALHYHPSEAPGFEIRRQRYHLRIEAIREAQRLGTVDPEIDPEATYLQLMGTVNWYFAAPQIAEMLVPSSSAESLLRFRTSLERTIRKALAP